MKFLILRFENQKIKLTIITSQYIKTYLFKNYKKVPCFLKNKRQLIIYIILNFQLSYDFNYHSLLKYENKNKQIYVYNKHYCLYNIKCYFSKFFIKHFHVSSEFCFLLYL